jgi:hypothetical protein
VRVRISDTNDAGVNDSSDADFAIMGGFAIASPNGAEVLVVSGSHDITWDTTGTVSNVKLDYSADGGTNWTEIVASTPNTELYTWTIPDAISITVKVRVSDAANADAFDISDNNFKIKGGLHVDSPNLGTESWSVGYEYPITWTRTGSVATVNLLYTANGDAGTPDWVSVTSGIAANLGTYSWTLPGDTTLSTKALIKVVDTTDTTVMDVSNNYFEVKGGLRVETPNAAGLSMQVGNSYNITWTKFGTIPNVDIHYSVNKGIAGGGTYPDGNLITTCAATLQQFQWISRTGSARSCAYACASRTTTTYGTNPTICSRSR